MFLFSIAFKKMFGKLTGPQLSSSIILKKEANLKGEVWNQILSLYTSLSCLHFWEDDYFLHDIQSKIYSNFAPT